MTKEQKDKLSASSIDVAEVMERTMGREDLLVRILHCYVESTVVDELQDAVDRNDFEEAFQRAHALKGMAGNLSLNAVKAVNMPLVEHLRNKIYDEVEEETEAVVEAHRKAVEGIREFLEMF